MQRQQQCSRHFSEQVSQRFNAMRVEESVSGFRFHAPGGNTSHFAPRRVAVANNDSDRNNHYPLAFYAG